jgi:hypothetical protein
MTIENQIATVEQSKRLGELLNISQWKNVDFNFYWVKTEASDPKYFASSHFGGYVYIKEVIPTFTVAELGVMLPTLGFEFCKSNDGKGGDFFWLTGHYRAIEGIKIEDKYEAQVRANMLIYLLEQNIATPEEVNNRLTNQ